MTIKNFSVWSIIQRKILTRKPVKAPTTIAFPINEMKAMDIGFDNTSRARLMLDLLVGTAIPPFKNLRIIYLVLYTPLNNISCWYGKIRTIYILHSN